MLKARPRIRWLVSLTIAASLFASSVTMALAVNWYTWATTDCAGSQAANGRGNLLWDTGNPFVDWGRTNAAIFWWDGSNCNWVMTDSVTRYGGSGLAEANVTGSGHQVWTTTAVYEASFFSGQRSDESPSRSCP